jgi:hypothetical protein
MMLVILAQFRTYLSCIDVPIPELSFWQWLSVISMGSALTLVMRAQRTNLWVRREKEKGRREAEEHRFAESISRDDNDMAFRKGRLVNLTTNTLPDAEDSKLRSDDAATNRSHRSANGVPGGRNRREPRLPPADEGRS